MFIFSKLSCVYWNQNNIAKRRFIPILKAFLMAKDIHLLLSLFLFFPFFVKDIESFFGKCISIFSIVFEIWGWFVLVFLRLVNIGGVWILWIRRMILRLLFFLILRLGIFWNRLWISCRNYRFLRGNRIRTFRAVARAKLVLVLDLFEILIG